MGFCCIIYIFLIISDAEKLVMFLLILCMYPLEMGFIGLFSTFLQWLVFHVCSLMLSYAILTTSHIYHIYLYIVLYSMHIYVASWILSSCHVHGVKKILLHSGVCLHLTDSFFHSKHTFDYCCFMTFI